MYSIRLRKHRRAFQAVSLVIAIQLVIPTSIWAQTQGLPKVLEPPSPAGPVVLLPKNILSLQVPESYGNIKQTTLGNQGKIVIHVQDSHVNYEAQTNIAQILKHLVQELTLQANEATPKPLIAIEGAAGPSNSKWFQLFPNEEAKKNVLDYYLRRGYISGPQLFQVFDKNNIPVVGVETPKLYLENLEFFRKTYANNTEILKHIEEIETALVAIRNAIFNEELIKASDKSKAFQNNSVNLTDYLDFLTELSNKQSVRLDRYEQVVLAKQAIDLEKSIDYDQVNKERNKLITRLKTALTKEDISELVTQSLYFRLGKTTSLDYYNFLEDISRGANVPIELYPELLKYIEALFVQEQIDGELLYKQILEVDKKTKEALYQTDEERKCDILLNRIQILENLAKLELSRDQLAEYREDPLGFMAEEFLFYIEEKLSALNLDVRISPDVDEINNYFDTLEGFYRTALARDNALMANTLKAMDAQDTQIAILVTGGFHTEGMVKLFEEKDVSTMVISPRLTEDFTNEGYLDVMMNEMLPLARVLNKKGNRISQPLQVFVDQPITGQLVQQFELHSELVMLYLAASTLSSDNQTAKSVNENLEKIKSTLLSELSGENQAQAKAILDAIEKINKVSEDERNDAITVEFEYLGEAVVVSVANREGANQLVRELRSLFERGLEKGTLGENLTFVISNKGTTDSVLGERKEVTVSTRSLRRQTDLQEKPITSIAKVSRRSVHSGRTQSRTSRREAAEAKAREGQPETSDTLVQILFSSKNTEDFSQTLNLLFKKISQLNAEVLKAQRAGKNEEALALSTQRYQLFNSLFQPDNNRPEGANAQSRLQTLVDQGIVKQNEIEALDKWREKVILDLAGDVLRRNQAVYDLITQDNGFKEYALNAGLKGREKQAYNQYVSSRIFLVRLGARPGTSNYAALKSDFDFNLIAESSIGEQLYRLLKKEVSQKIDMQAVKLDFFLQTPDYYETFDVNPEIAARDLFNPDKYKVAEDFVRRLSLQGEPFKIGEEGTVRRSPTIQRKIRSQAEKIVQYQRGAEGPELILRQLYDLTRLFDKQTSEFETTDEDIRKAAKAILRSAEGFLIADDALRQKLNTAALAAALSKEKDSFRPIIDLIEQSSLSKIQKRLIRHAYDIYALNLPIEEVLLDEKLRIQFSNLGLQFVESAYRSTEEKIDYEKQRLSLPLQALIKTYAEAKLSPSEQEAFQDFYTIVLETQLARISSPKTRLATIRKFNLELQRVDLLLLRAESPFTVPSLGKISSITIVEKDRRLSERLKTAEISKLVRKAQLTGVDSLSSEEEQLLETFLERFNENQPLLYKLIEEGSRYPFLTELKTVDKVFAQVAYELERVEQTEGETTTFTLKELLTKMTNLKELNSRKTKDEASKDLVDGFRELTRSAEFKSLFPKKGLVGAVQKFHLGLALNKTDETAIEEYEDKAVKVFDEGGITVYQVPSTEEEISTAQKALQKGEALSEAQLSSQLKNLVIQITGRPDPKIISKFLSGQFRELTTVSRLAEATDPNAQRDQVEVPPVIEVFPESIERFVNSQLNRIRELESLRNFEQAEAVYSDLADIVSSFNLTESGDLLSTSHIISRIDQAKKDIAAAKNPKDRLIKILKLEELVRFARRESTGVSHSKFKNARGEALFVYDVKRVLESAPGDPIRQTQGANLTGKFLGDGDGHKVGSYNVVQTILELKQFKAAQDRGENPSLEKLLSQTGNKRDKQLGVFLHVYAHPEKAALEIKLLSADQFIIIRNKLNILQERLESDVRAGRLNLPPPGTEPLNLYRQVKELLNIDRSSKQNFANGIAAFGRKLKKEGYLGYARGGDELAVVIQSPGYAAAIGILVDLLTHKQEEGAVIAFSGGVGFAQITPNIDFNTISKQNAAALKLTKLLKETSIERAPLEKYAYVYGQPLTPNVADLVVRGAISQINSARSATDLAKLEDLTLPGDEALWEAAFSESRRAQSKWKRIQSQLEGITKKYKNVFTDGNRIYVQAQIRSLPKARQHYFDLLTSNGDRNALQEEAYNFLIQTLTETSSRDPIDVALRENLSREISVAVKEKKSRAFSKGVLAPIYSQTARLIPRVLNPFLSFLNRESIDSEKLQKRIAEDVVVPLIEEGLLLLTLFFGGPAYLLARAFFVAGHALQDRDARKNFDGFLRATFIPALISVFATLPLLLNPAGASVGLIALIGLTAHIGLNSLVTQAALSSGKANFNPVREQVLKFIESLGQQKKRPGIKGQESLNNKVSKLLKYLNAQLANENVTAQTVKELLDKLSNSYSLEILGLQDQFNQLYEQVSEKSVSEPTSEADYNITGENSETLGEVIQLLNEAIGASRLRRVYLTTNKTDLARRQELRANQSAAKIQEKLRTSQLFSRVDSVTAQLLFKRLQNVITNYSAKNADKTLSELRSLRREINEILIPQGYYLYLTLETDGLKKSISAKGGIIDAELTQTHTITNERGQQQSFNVYYVESLIQGLGTQLGFSKKFGQHNLLDGDTVVWTEHYQGEVKQTKDDVRDYFGDEAAQEITADKIAQSVEVHEARHGYDARTFVSERINIVARAQNQAQNSLATIFRQLTAAGIPRAKAVEAANELSAFLAEIGVGPIPKASFVDFLNRAEGFVNSSKREGKSAHSIAALILIEQLLKQAGETPSNGNVFNYTPSQRLTYASDVSNLLGKFNDLSQAEINQLLRTLAEQTYQDIFESSLYVGNYAKKVEAEPVALETIPLPEQSILEKYSTILLESSGVKLAKKPISIDPKTQVIQLGSDGKSVLKFKLSPTGQVEGISIFNNESLEDFPIKAGKTYKVGRSNKVEITVSSPGISRQHLSFEVTQDNKIIVQDLNSGNGTFIRTIKESPKALPDAKEPVDLLESEEVIEQAVEAAPVETEKTQLVHTEASRQNKKKSPTNEDASFTLALNNGITVSAVLDGVGGGDAGDLASNTAKAVLQEQLGALQYAQKLTKESVRTILLRAFETARLAVDEAAKREDKPTTNTTVVVSVSFINENNERVVVIANAGDSRGYVFRNNEQSLEQVTEDDSLIRSLAYDWATTGLLGQNEQQVLKARYELTRSSETEDVERVLRDVFRNNPSTGNFKQVGLSLIDNYYSIYAVPGRFSAAKARLPRLYSTLINGSATVLDSAQAKTLRKELRDIKDSLAQTEDTRQIELLLTQLRQSTLNLLNQIIEPQNSDLFISILANYYYGLGNVITSDLRRTNDQNLSIFSTILQPNDRLILTSDGVHDNVTFRQLEQKLGQLKAGEGAQALVDLAYQINRKDDDITAVEETYLPQELEPSRTTPEPIAQLIGPISLAVMAFEANPNDQTAIPVFELNRQLLEVINQLTGAPVRSLTENSLFNTLAPEDQEWIRASADLMNQYNAAYVTRLTNDTRFLTQELQRLRSITTELNKVQSAQLYFATTRLLNSVTTAEEQTIALLQIEALSTIRRHYFNLLKEDNSPYAKQIVSRIIELAENTGDSSDLTLLEEVKTLSPQEEVKQPYSEETVAKINQLITNSSAIGSLSQGRKVQLALLDTFQVGGESYTVLGDPQNRGIFLYNTTANTFQLVTYQTLAQPNGIQIKQAQIKAINGGVVLIGNGEATQEQRVTLYRANQAEVSRAFGKGVLFPVYQIASAIVTLPFHILSTDPKSRIFSRTDFSKKSEEIKRRYYVFIEDVLVPAIEEGGLFFLLATFGPVGYLIGRLLFVFGHLFNPITTEEEFAQTRKEDLIAVSKMLALPTLISIVTLAAALPFAVITPYVFLIGLATHIASNLYVSYSNTTLEKAVLGKSALFNKDITPVDKLNAFIMELDSLPIEEQAEFLTKNRGLLAQLRFQVEGVANRDIKANTNLAYLSILSFIYAQTVHGGPSSVTLQSGQKTPYGAWGITWANKLLNPDSEANNNVFNNKLDTFVRNQKLGQNEAEIKTVFKNLADKLNQRALQESALNKNRLEQTLEALINKILQSKYLQKRFDTISFNAFLRKVLSQELNLNKKDMSLVRFITQALTPSTEGYGTRESVVDPDKATIEAGRAKFLQRYERLSKEKVAFDQLIDQMNNRNKEFVNLQQQPGSSLELSDGSIFSIGDAYFRVSRIDENNILLSSYNSNNKENPYSTTVLAINNNYEFKIGRGTDTNLRLPLPNISRNHASLRIQNGRVYLVDNNSSNGTFVIQDRTIDDAGATISTNVRDIYQPGEGTLREVLGYEIVSTEQGDLFEGMPEDDYWPRPYWSTWESGEDHPEQFWKVHVAATLRPVIDQKVAVAITKYLRERNVAHKIHRPDFIKKHTADEVEKRDGVRQTLKLITLYPKDRALAIELAAEIETLIEKLTAEDNVKAKPIQGEKPVNRDGGYTHFRFASNKSDYGITYFEDPNTGEITQESREKYFVPAWEGGDIAPEVRALYKKLKGVEEVDQAADPFIEFNNAFLALKNNPRISEVRNNVREPNKPLPNQQNKPVVQVAQEIVADATALIQRLEQTNRSLQDARITKLITEAKQLREPFNRYLTAIAQAEQAAEAQRIAQLQSAQRAQQAAAEEQRVAQQKSDAEALVLRLTQQGIDVLNQANKTSDINEALSLLSQAKGAYFQAERTMQANKLTSKEFLSQFGKQQATFFQLRAEREKIFIDSAAVTVKQRLAPLQTITADPSKPNEVLDGTSTRLELARKTLTELDSLYYELRALKLDARVTFFNTSIEATEAGQLKLIALIEQMEQLLKQQEERRIAQQQEAERKRAEAAEAAKAKEAQQQRVAQQQETERKRAEAAEAERKLAEAAYQDIVAKMKQIKLDERITFSLVGIYPDEVIQNGQTRVAFAGDTLEATQLIVEELEALARKHQSAALVELHEKTSIYSEQLKEHVEKLRKLYGERQKIKADALTKVVQATERLKLGLSSLDKSSNVLITYIKNARTNFADATAKVTNNLLIDIRFSSRWEQEKQNYFLQLKALEQVLLDRADRAIVKFEKDLSYGSFSDSSKEKIAPNTTREQRARSLLMEGRRLRQEINTLRLGFYDKDDKTKFALLDESEQRKRSELSLLEARIEVKESTILGLLNLWNGIEYINRVNKILAEAIQSNNLTKVKAAKEKAEALYELTGQFVYNKNLTANKSFLFAWDTFREQYLITIQGLEAKLVAPVQSLANQISTLIYSREWTFIEQDPKNPKEKLWGNNKDRFAMAKEFIEAFVAFEKRAAELDQQLSNEATKALIEYVATNKNKLDKLNSSLEAAVKEEKRAALRAKAPKRGKAKEKAVAKVLKGKETPTHSLLREAGIVPGVADLSPPLSRVRDLNELTQKIVARITRIKNNLVREELTDAYKKELALAYRYFQALEKPAEALPQEDKERLRASYRANRGVGFFAGVTAEKITGSNATQTGALNLSQRIFRRLVIDGANNTNLIKNANEQISFLIGAARENQVRLEALDETPLLQRRIRALKNLRANLSRSKKSYSQLTTLVQEINSFNPAEQTYEQGIEKLNKIQALFKDYLAVLQNIDRSIIPVEARNEEGGITSIGRDTLVAQLLTAQNQIKAQLAAIKPATPEIVVEEVVPEEKVSVSPSLLVFRPNGIYKTEAVKKIINTFTTPEAVIAFANQYARQAVNVAQERDQEYTEKQALYLEVISENSDRGERHLTALNRLGTLTLSKQLHKRNTVVQALELKQLLQLLRTETPLGKTQRLNYEDITRANKNDQQDFESLNNLLISFLALAKRTPILNRERETRWAAIQLNNYILALIKNPKKRPRAMNAWFWFYQNAIPDFARYTIALSLELKSLYKARVSTLLDNAGLSQFDFKYLFSSKQDAERWSQTALKPKEQELFQRLRKNKTLLFVNEETFKKSRISRKDRLLLKELRKSNDFLVLVRLSELNHEITETHYSYLRSIKEKEADPRVAIRTFKPEGTPPVERASFEDVIQARQKQDPSLFDRTEEALAVIERQALTSENRARLVIEQIFKEAAEEKSPTTVDGYERMYLKILEQFPALLLNEIKRLSKNAILNRLQLRLLAIATSIEQKNLREDLRFEIAREQVEQSAEARRLYFDKFFDAATTSSRETALLTSVIRIATSGLTAEDDYIRNRLAGEAPQARAAQPQTKAPVEILVPASISTPADKAPAKDSGAVERGRDQALPQLLQTDSPRERARNSEQVKELKANLTRFIEKIGPSIFDSFANASLTTPSEGDLRNSDPARYYQEVLETGIYSDLVNLVASIDIFSIDEDPELFSDVVAIQALFERKVGALNILSQTGSYGLTYSKTGKLAKKDEEIELKKLVFALDAAHFPIKDGEIDFDNLNPDIRDLLLNSGKKGKSTLQIILFSINPDGADEVQKVKDALNQSYIQTANIETHSTRRGLSTQSTDKQVNGFVNRVLGKAKAFKATQDNVIFLTTAENHKNVFSRSLQEFFLYLVADPGESTYYVDEALAESYKEVTGEELPEKLEFVPELRFDDSSIDNFKREQETKRAA